jgi:NAD(P)-dependent dehydrogenase (short-subunit alcohol dehydrogenase family)
MSRLDGKVAFITGAGSGIGQATATLFAREGAKVVVSDISAEGGEKTVEMIKADGNEAMFVKTDVTQSSEVEGAINMAVNAYGRLDCAFNNAGGNVGEASPLAESTEEIWERVINLNLKGVWLCMKYEIMQMLKQGSGAIVNASSIAGLVGFPGMPVYSAGKHGVIGLTKTAALEYAQAGIRVNAVCPSMIYTPAMEAAIADFPELEANLKNDIPIGRIGGSEEIGEAVVWLCSDQASFVTGHAMPVDGGFMAK